MYLEMDYSILFLHICFPTMESEPVGIIESPESLSCDHETMCMDMEHLRKSSR